MLPLVFGYDTMPSSSNSARTSCAVSSTSAQPVPGIGSRSMRSSSGCSTWSRRVGQGWKSRHPLFAAQATCATSTGHSSVAFRPLGNVTVTVSSHGGRLSGTRFW